MTKTSLGWQSWSPPTPNLFHIPRRDYPPNFTFPTTLTVPTATLHSHLKFSYWCSWYALGYFPTAKRILAQAQLIKKHHLSIEYILIDDGWVESWLPGLCSDLHTLGFKVGLWYAPYTRHKNLPAYKTLSKLINSCKLDLLKLDFLYQPYFNKNTVNPTEVLSELFSFLKTNFPQLISIGCGVPFSDAIGKLNVIRLSKDTSLPYPAPRLLNQLFYSRRMRLLEAKYHIWQKQKSFIPDPDVRMFSLDNSSTKDMWGKMSYRVKGLGDNIDFLSKEQLKEAKIWLNH